MSSLCMSADDCHPTEASTTVGSLLTNGSNDRNSPSQHGQRLHFHGRCLWPGIQFNMLSGPTVIGAMNPGIDRAVGPVRVAATVATGYGCDLALDPGLRRPVLGLGHRTVLRCSTGHGPAPCGHELGE